MFSLSRSTQSLTAILCATFLLGGLSELRAGGTGASAGTRLDDQAQREIVRRQENLVLAERLIEQGDEAMRHGDYETAYIHYLDAVEKIPAGPATERDRSRAIDKFSRGAMAYAEWLIQNGRFSDAEKVAKTILLPEFNPTYRPAVRLLSNLEQPDYYNKTITPQFAEQRDEVVDLLRQAKDYYGAGRYDIATRRYEQVLAIDPYNSAARMGMEEVDRARTQYGRAAYNETRSRMLWQVTQAWERPFRRLDERPDDDFGLEREEVGTEVMQSKLNRIIIPRIDLRDATLREAVQFLRQQSEVLDPAAEGERRGVNIVLSLDMPGMRRGEEAPDVGVSPDTRVTLALNNVPLGEALRYLGELSGLRVKVEAHAVQLVPLSVPVDTLIQREWRVSPGLIPPTAPDQDDFAPRPGAAPAVGAARIQGRMSARAFLEESTGMSFPPGAFAQYIPAGSRLVVRNTPDNIDLVDTLVRGDVGQLPTQVEIQSKFLEISQHNLRELGFDWLLGPFSIPGSDSVFVSGGDPRLGGNVFPFADATGLPVGQNLMTRGLRTGSGAGPGAAVSVNSLEALLATVGGSGILDGPAPGIFGISGIFTNPQFQVLIRALDQRKGVDLMTAPKVVTKSGAKAVVRVTRRFFYPTEFDPPQIPQSTQSVGGTGTIGVLAVASLPPPTVTPSHPTGWQERDLGVTLEVEPVVGPDSYTIDLSLTPQVVDFDGFINYGSPINSVGRQFDPLTLTLVPVLEQLTSNVINQPIFSTRTVNTNVTIWDGQTVALGGLMREDVQKVQDKVPLLGDIPIAGRLFRSDVDQKIKRNLIIFVTARLIDPHGLPIRRDDYDDEAVDLLGLPPDLPRPELPALPTRYKK